MSEAAALAVLRLLAEEDGQSLPRIAKRLRLSLSELQRLLAALGDDPRFDGLDLIELRTPPARADAPARTQARAQPRAWLTARGRALCAGDAYARVAPADDADSHRASADHASAGIAHARTTGGDGA